MKLLNAASAPEMNPVIADAADAAELINALPAPTSSDVNPSKIDVVCDCSRVACC